LDSGAAKAENLSNKDYHSHLYNKLNQAKLMADSELEHLRKMANQISANFSFHDDQADKIADHITRFWAPSMRTLFWDYIEAGGQGVDEPVRVAMTGISSA
jgi:formate dehydrogenase subunit delta